jgi:predicted dehydrogenase
MGLRVGIVGCGKIADGHVEEIAKMSARAQVVAVCDLELLMAEQLAVRYKIPHFYDSVSQMLEREQLDVLHITTPPQSHRDLALAGIAAGCHVYVEKPLTLSYPDSRRLVDAAIAAKRLVTVGYSNYYDPSIQKMRELIAAGVLGDIVHVETMFGYNLAGGFGTAIMADPHHWVHWLPGKLFHNNIDHMLSKVTEFIEDDEPVIHATGFALREVRFGDSRDAMLDELRLTMIGKRVSMYGTFSAAIRPVGQFMRVYGTRGSVHVDLVCQTVVLDSTPTFPSAIGRLLPAFAQGKAYRREGRRNVRRFLRSEFHFMAGMHEIISRFYDSILDGKELPVSYRDMLRVSWMLDEIFRQVPQAVVP